MSQSTFPYRLHRVLAAVSKTDQDASVLSWTPSGRTFRIHDLNAFKTQILPKYFPNQKKYGSFRRQLQYYDFSTLGINHFGHPLFIRNQVELLDHIKHKKQGKSTQARQSRITEHKKETQVVQTPCCSRITNYLRGAQSRSSNLCNAAKHSQVSRQLVMDAASKEEKALWTRQQLDLDYLLVLALQQRRELVANFKRQALLSAPHLLRANTDPAFLELARLQLGLYYS